MQEVRMYLSHYDDLQSRIRAKADRVNALEQEIEKLKNDHEQEIESLTKLGKVKVVSKPYNMFKYLFRDDEPPVEEYKGFDDVKSEVEEHFKQGLFNEQLEKYEQEHLQNLIKQMSEKDEANEKLRSEISRLKNRSLIQRIFNK